MDWRPSATLAMLRRRAQVLATIRARFARQGVLEVETPLLARSSCLDPQVPSIGVPLADGQRWLQTSPENHMKRLLAAGSGPIYRLGPVFRAGERGRWHAPEFCMLEWYRPGLDAPALMADVAALLAELGAPRSWRRRRYADLYAEQLGWDVHATPTAQMRAWAAGQGLADAAALPRDALLDFAMGTVIGPTLGQEGLDFVEGYPASQAALARLDPADAREACRFELYWRGLELANGFHELADAEEQRQRFAAEAATRAAEGLDEIAVDDHLLDALAAGLPDCSGVALGLDRLIALLAGAERLDAVQAFTWEQA